MHTLMCQSFWIIGWHWKSTKTRQMRRETFIGISSKNQVRHSKHPSALQVYLFLYIVHRHKYQRIGISDYSPERGCGNQYEWNRQPGTIQGLVFLLGMHLLLKNYSRHILVVSSLYYYFLWQILLTWSFPMLIVWYPATLSAQTCWIFILIQHLDFYSAKDATGRMLSAWHRCVPLYAADLCGVGILIYLVNI